MPQVTTESECARLSVADLLSWADDIQAEALDVWSHAETSRLRAQLESIKAELATRGVSL